MRCSSCSAGHLSCVSLLHSLWLVSGDGVPMNDLHCLYRVLFHLRCYFQFIFKDASYQTVFNCHTGLCVRVCAFVCFVDSVNLHPICIRPNSWRMDGAFTPVCSPAHLCVFFEACVGVAGWVFLCVYWEYHVLFEYGIHVFAFSRCAIKSLTWLHNTF